ncbi:MAG: bifunctional glycosyltransferase family 2/GtrA family protein [Actinomycetia bacterium]|nr:bifunctional glycosyltransferase family 2/GtrA family protein [Actinomycetes bacterium]
MPGPTVDVTVPVYNEEHVLRVSIERLHAYLSASFPFGWQITIADNASTDRTRAIAHELAAELPNVRVVEIDRKGRGLALRTAWSSSTAEIVAYMDVDLSTGVNALLPLVASIHSGHSEIGIGSRLAPAALVARGPRREFISRCYNRVLRLVFVNRFRDAQCGFKVARRDIVELLLPLVHDNAWFFDTELLLVAEHNGLRVFEIPVDWVDDPDSRVHVVSTATEDLKGVLRVAKTFARGGGRVDLGSLSRPGLSDDMGRQLVSFGVVGATSTIASLAIYLGSRGSLAAAPAAGLAYGIVTLVNSWANRRFTFGHRGRDDRGSHLLRLGAAAVVGVISSMVVADFASDHRVRESLALIGLWLSLAAIRFALLRAWVFRSRPKPTDVQRTRWAAK